MQNQNPNAQSTNTLAILWYALLSSQLMFLIVLAFAKREVFNFDFSKPVLGENASVIIACAVLGVSTFLLSFVLRKKFINQAINQQKPALVQTALIVGCALCEATTLLGLILAFAFNYSYFFLWFALGILGTVLHYPRAENISAASYKMKS
ncbi:MAG: hypothetical protein M3033_11005 [Acidobacteriota bacterium]|nr:hypothetical protein [Acidobacteriota bacterium]